MSLPDEMAPPASPRLADGLRGAAIGLLVLACIGGGAFALGRPLDRWLRRSEGFLIVPRTEVERVRIERPGEPAIVSFALDNVTDRPVAVLAAESSCDCTTIQGLPITIPSRGEATLSFRLATTPAEAGRHWKSRIKLLLDTPSPVVVLEIAAEVGAIESPASGSVEVVSPGQ